MMLKKLTLLLAIAVISCKSAQQHDLEDGLYADVKTTKGDMVIKLTPEKTPITVANFVTLAEGTNVFVKEDYKNKKYYDGITFHRVIKDFMIQGGDPTGTGAGDPGYKFKDEFHDSLTHSKAGILSMANAGPGTNGSQFFITHKATPFLNKRHTVFGEVVQGLSTIDSIANVKTAAQDKPVEDVVINTITIIRVGKQAKKFNAVKVISDYFENKDAEEKALKQKQQAVIKQTLAKFAAQKAKATTTKTGLQYFVSEPGKGAKLKTSDKVNTHYAVYFEDGSLLQTSKLEIAEKYGVVNPGRKAANGYMPIPADLSPQASMIPGFKEGIQALSIGDKATLFLPSHLAYGETGTRGIAPNTNLIFEIEVIDYVK